jgi:hypothetical protein
MFSPRYSYEPHFTILGLFPSNEAAIAAAYDDLELCFKDYLFEESKWEGSRGHVKIPMAQPTYAVVPISEYMTEHGIGCALMGLELFLEDVAKTMKPLDVKLSNLRLMPRPVPN